MMIVSYDIEAGATYVELSEAAVSRTVSVSDLVMVDIDDHDQPVGVDFAVPPNRVTQMMVDRVAERFPQLKKLAHLDEWLLAHA